MVDPSQQPARLSGELVARLLRPLQFQQRFERRWVADIIDRGELLQSRLRLLERWNQRWGAGEDEPAGGLPIVHALEQRGTVAVHVQTTVKQYPVVQVQRVQARSPQIEVRHEYHKLQARGATPGARVQTRRETHVAKPERHQQVDNIVHKHVIRHGSTQNTGQSQVTPARAPKARVGEAQTPATAESTTPTANESHASEKLPQVKQRVQQPIVRVPTPPTSQASGSVRPHIPNRVVKPQQASTAEPPKTEHAVVQSPMPQTARTASQTVLSKTATSAEGQQYTGPTAATSSSVRPVRKPVRRPTRQSVWTPKQAGKEHVQAKLSMPHERSAEVEGAGSITSPTAQRPRETTRPRVKPRLVHTDNPATLPHTKKTQPLEVFTSQAPSSHGQSPPVVTPQRPATRNADVLRARQQPPSPRHANSPGGRSSQLPHLEQAHAPEGRGSNQTRREHTSRGVQTVSPGPVMPLNTSAQTNHTPQPLPLQHTQQPLPELDIDKLVTTVQRRLVRELKWDREGRRGIR